VTKTSLQPRVKDLDTFKAFSGSKYLSLKYTSYFDTYDDLLARYRGREIVFVEIGVFHGGSLFMWRDYLGDKARIIGIDFNPEAKKWAGHGFEIHIGDQADPAFWERFFRAAGDVDVILDDGGHTNEQQVVTTAHCLPHIRDGGMLIVEDTHTSYLARFGNPSRRSFVNYARMIVDSVNSRSVGVYAASNPLDKIVWSTAFYDSIVCFRVDRTKCFASRMISNEGGSDGAIDFRHEASAFDRAIAGLNEKAQRNPVFGGPVAKALGLAQHVSARMRSRKIAKYFRARGA
jgi:hypothetical protein